MEYVYDGALGRSTAGDPKGGQFWLDALSHGVSRAEVAVGIAESPEAQAHLLASIEAGYHLA